MPFSLLGLPNLKVFDPDDAGGEIRLTLTCSAGAFALPTAGNSGIDGITINGTSTIVSFKGTTVELNNYLRGLTTGTLLFSTAAPGTITFTVVALDPTGQSSTISFAIQAVDLVAPVVTAPAGPLALNIGEGDLEICGTGFTISDADDQGLPGQLELSVTGGTLTCLSGTSGVELVSGDGTSTLTVSGTLVRLQSLLAGETDASILYSHDTSGSYTLTVEYADSDEQTDEDDVSISVGYVPVVAKPSSTVVAIQSTPLNLEGLGFEITDPDASGTYTLVLETTVAGSTIDVTVGDSGVTIVGGDTTSEVELSGNLSQLNSLLDDSSTGTIVLDPGASLATGFLNVSATDATGRTGSTSANLRVDSSTPTWRGYAEATAVAATGTLNGIPTLIDLSRMPDEWWNEVTSNGRDIRVTTNSNVQVACDLIPGTFSKANKTGVLFARLNHTTSQSPVRVWVGAGSATALGPTDTYGQHATYGNWIFGFWPSGAGNDRTAYLNHLSPSGGLIEGGASGPAGLPATTYDGVDDWSQATAAIAGALPVVMSAAVRAAGANTAQNVMTIGPSGVQRVDLGLLPSVNQLAVISRSFASSASNAAYAQAVGSFPNGSWTMVSAEVSDTKARRAFLNGANVGSNTGKSAVNLSGSRLRIGVSQTGGEWLNGDVCFAFATYNLAPTVVPAFLLQCSRMLDQQNFWSPFTFTSDSITGL